jgi:dihydroceramide fatty acyl 2-hydroxylase
MPDDLADLPRVFALSRLGYYADFVLAPAAAGGLIADYLRGGRPLGRLWLLLLIGLLAWQLAEYLIHRFAFHGPLARLHDVHHRLPAAYVGVASYGAGTAFGVAWASLALIFNVAAADAVTAGVLAGYLFYIAIHDRMHHGDRARFGRYVAYMHAFHGGHHRGGHFNFGVSSPLLDLIFRTYRAPR